MSKTDELCNKNEEPCIKNEDFFFKMMNFAVLARRKWQLRSSHVACVRRGFHTKTVEILFSIKVFYIYIELKIF